MLKSVPEEHVKVHKISGNGFCFIYAIEYAMKSNNINVIPYVPALSISLHHELFRHINKMVSVAKVYPNR